MREGQYSPNPWKPFLEPFLRQEHASKKKAGLKIWSWIPLGIQHYCRCLHPDELHSLPFGLLQVRFSLAWWHPGHRLWEIKRSSGHLVASQVDSATRWRGRHHHPPSAARLLGFLRKLWSKSYRTKWVHLELKKFAAMAGLSERQVQRAKNHLQSSGAVVFVTVSNQAGSRGHRVYAADPDELVSTSQTLLAWTSTGRERNRRDKIGAALHPLPCSRVTFSSEKPQVSVGSGRHEPPDISGFPLYREKAYGIRKHSLHEVNGLGSGRFSAAAPPGQLRWSPNREETRSERALAWFVTRRISELWWENCKVQHPGEKLGGVFNLALRWIRRGVNYTDIVKNFRASLEKMHGLCVDLQLLRGDPGLRFTVGSTITRTDRALCSLFFGQRLKHWSSSVVVQA